jgi:hypothetical protein
MIVAVDFDGTIVKHAFPSIGEEIPGAIFWLKKWQEMGHRLILFTVRTELPLAQAVDWCRDRGLEFWGINQNPEYPPQKGPHKVHAHLYIDDRGVCCPLKDGRVDWRYVGPYVASLGS